MANKIKKLEGVNFKPCNTNENFNIEYSRKPVAVCNSMIGKVSKESLSQNSSNFVMCQLSAKELASSISSGYAFCTQFNESRKIENFKQAGFIALDIDHGMTLEDALDNEFVKKFASFIYTTPGHRSFENRDRFRIVLELGSPISDVTTVTNLIKALLLKFPKADKACKDPTRIFFGSPNCEIHYIDQILSIEEVNKLITSNIKQDAQLIQSHDDSEIKSSIQVDDIRKMLNYIDPMPGYSIWRDICWAVKSWCVQNGLQDSIGKELIEVWSPDYKTEGYEVEKLFREYQHGLISIRTLIFYAQNKGYEVPKKFVKPRTPGQALVEDLFYDSDSYATINGELCKYNLGIYEPISNFILEQSVSKYFDSYITDFKTGKTGYATKASIVDAINFAKTWFYKDPSNVNPPGLNLKNGYLKLSYASDGKPIWELVPHSAKNIFTYKAEFDYDPEVDPDIFDQAIDDILDHKGQEILFRSISASFDLDQVRKRQGRAVRILLLYGDGSNGKDTVREWVYKFYGQNGITSIPLQAFRNADSGKLNNIYDIGTSRINWSSENAAVSLDNCQTLKNCMTGDPIYIERKYFQGHSTKVKAVFFFNVNQLPRLEAKQEAISSRYGILYFQNTFKSKPDESDPTQKKADPRLKDDTEHILENIMPAFLNRLIRSYEKLLNQGIDYSSCKALLQDIRERNDHFAEFLSEHPLIECEVKQGLNARSIYDKYVEWCKQSGLIEDCNSHTIFNDPSSNDRVIRSEVKITHKLLEYFPRLNRSRSNGKRILGIKFLIED